jgi:hypothetical protein
VRAGTLGALTSTIGHTPLLCGVIAPPGLFSPLGILLGDGRGFLERLGGPAQDR